MAVKTKEKVPMKFTTIKLDFDTSHRLKALAVGMPVAQYLRSLTQELLQDKPPSLDKLKVGYSLAPIKRQLDHLQQRVDEIASVVMLLDKKGMEVVFGKEKQVLQLAVMNGAILSVLDDLVPGIRQTIMEQAPGEVERQWSQFMKKHPPVIQELVRDYEGREAS